ncbi:MAG: DUF1573 domain-containing protein [Bacteroidota bacterium]|nr:DUF1573 domain-containing protein [Bacteroidota bacterium]
MNKVFGGFCLICILFSCDIRNSRNNNDVLAKNTGQAFKDSTTVQLIDSAYNFGKVMDGEKVEYSYRFKNTGKNPLIVSSAVASCGCTVPEKPEEPIQPGQTGFLKVVFNSKGRVGEVHKEITVTSNAYPSFPVLQLTGQVESSQK